MSPAEGLCQRIGEVSRRLPDLGRRQAWVLAVFRYGMVMKRRSGLSSEAHYIAVLQGKKVNAVRQCLREWCYDAADKRGGQRQEVEVRRCFSGVLKWILA